MHLISIAYSISFLGLYLSLFLWGLWGIKTLCEAYLVMPFWPLFIFALAMVIIHVLRFSGKNSVLHTMVPAVYGISLIWFLQGDRLYLLSLPLCIGISLIFVVLNAELLKYFKKQQKKKKMVPIRFNQNGFEITEDLRFLDRRLSWDYFKLIETRK